MLTFFVLPALVVVLVIFTVLLCVVGHGLRRSCGGGGRTWAASAITPRQLKTDERPVVVAGVCSTGDWKDTATSNKVCWKVLRCGHVCRASFALCYSFSFICYSIIVVHFTYFSCILDCKALCGAWTFGNVLYKQTWPWFRLLHITFLALHW